MCLHSHGNSNTQSVIRRTSLFVYLTHCKHSLLLLLATFFWEHSVTLRFRDVKRLQRPKLLWQIQHSVWLYLWLGHILLSTWRTQYNEVHRFALYLIWHWLLTKSCVCMRACACLCMRACACLCVRACILVIETLSRAIRSKGRRKCELVFFQ